jgi:hypothetical protein
MIALAVGCSHKPPATFAPDPEFIRGMRALRVTATPARVCPGGLINAYYEAQLESGLWYPFARTYDKKRPPKLHIVFLRRTSPEASPLADGNWATAPDPTLSAMNGFRLTAFMRDNPTVQGFATVEPEYSCVPHAFSFEGEPGPPGGTGANGPDVTVRLRYLSSPFYQKLLVASVEVGVAPPIYVFSEADRIPPADWIIIETRGGRGGRGTAGTPGQNGANGAPGCPGGAGGAGGPGGPGGNGGGGGRGGRVTVIVPSNEPLLAGLVEGQSIGGQGGGGGPGGNGGAGGKGGVIQGSPGQQCQTGSNGAEGAKGRAGTEGPDGPPGPRPSLLTVSRSEVFGSRVSEQLAQLISYSDARKP